MLLLCVKLMKAFAFCQPVSHRPEKSCLAAFSLYARQREESSIKRIAQNSECDKKKKRITIT